MTEGVFEPVITGGVTSRRLLDTALGVTVALVALAADFPGLTAEMLDPPRTIDAAAIDGPRALSLWNTSRSPHPNSASDAGTVTVAAPRSTPDWPATMLVETGFSADIDKAARALTAANPKINTATKP